MTLKDKPIFIIPLTSFGSWSWAADYIRQTVLTLSKIAFEVVVYMDSEGSFFMSKHNVALPHIKNVHFYSPKYPLPFKRFSLISDMNKSFDFLRLVNNLGKNRKIIFWTFGPVPNSILKIVNKFKNITSLYDCVDYYGSTNSKVDEYKKSSENELIRSVDYFFVNSNSLLELHSKVRSAHLVVQGFAADIYRTRINKKTKLPTTKPLIGFIGSLDLRLDFKLLFEVIKKFQNCNFVLWGPVHDGELIQDRGKYKIYKKIIDLPNVIYGKSNRSQIPNIIKSFDIAIIPYDIKINFCKYCYPMKLFEYFYLGKPVVSTPVNELKRFPELVHIAKNTKEWQFVIKNMLRKEWPSNLIKIQRELALKNSWENKVGQILNKLGVLTN